jgi:uncharacterized protein YggT (Ycf19 family)
LSSSSIAIIQSAPITILTLLVMVMMMMLLFLAAAAVATIRSQYLRNTMRFFVGALDAPLVERILKQKTEEVVTVFSPDALVMIVKAIKDVKVVVHDYPRYSPSIRCPRAWS